MTIHDFDAEEQELINTGEGRTLQEFRRQLVFDLEAMSDEDMRHFVKTVFDKFRLITEREWEEIQKYLPLPGMGLNNEEKYNVFLDE